MNEVPPIKDISLPPFKDRRTGLIVFGGLEIALGCLIFLMIALMLLGQAMLARSAGTFTGLRMILYAVAIYLGLAALFVSLGVGSIQCRRWARALTLIVAWPWLATGLMTLPVMAIVLPRIVAVSAPQGQAMPAGFLKIILLIQFAVMGVFLIVVPGVLLLFYGRRDVKATCETRDPVHRWTDDVPLPVLGVALALWVGSAFFPLFGIAYRGVMPLFGTIFSGLPGILVIVTAAALWFWLGLMWYRRKLIGWWILLAILVFFGISNAITFSRIDMMDLFRKMGYPESQIDLMRRQLPALRDLMIWSSFIGVVPLLGYLIWTKRFFRHSHPANQPASTPSPL